MLKKIFLMTAIFLPFSVFAASLHLGDYFLKGTETAPDDIYVVGNTAAFTGRVNGDAVAAGRSVFSQSEIQGDALFLGERVKVAGTVEDDARLLGGIVEIDGIIKDDVAVLGSKVVVSKTARIEGSLYVAGGDVEIRGAVLKDVKLASGKALMSGQVKGDMEQWGTISFTEGAEIGGDLIRHGSPNAPPPIHVSITGKVIEGAGSDAMADLPLRSLLSGFFSLKALMMLAVAFTLFFLARERTEGVLLEALSQFGARAVRGLLIMLILPLVAVLLAPTIIGIPIAVVLGALFLVLLILSWACAGIILGAFLEQHLFKRAPVPLTYRPVLIGTLLISILSLIPFIGPLFHGILLLGAAGSLGTLFWRALHSGSVS